MWNSPRMQRRWPSGETRHCQIKTAPEKMHRTAFAAETRAKVLKHAIALQQDAPKPICIFWIVGSMLVVLIEWNRGFNLVGRRVNRRVDLKLAEGGHDLAIKCRNRSRAQLNNLHRSVAFQDAQFVIDEIETNFEN